MLATLRPTAAEVRSPARAAPLLGDRRALGDAERLTLARAIAERILRGFERHRRIFTAHTRRARRHFATGDWQGARRNGSARVTLYDQRVRECIGELRQAFDLGGVDTALWREVKFQYLGLLYEHRQPELAETFYNSVFVGLFERRFYDNHHLFVRPAMSTERILADTPVFRSYYPGQDGWRSCLRRLLADIEIALPFEHPRRDMRRVLRHLRGLQRLVQPLAADFQLQVLRPVFYRNKGAYVIGRVINGAQTQAFILPLLRSAEGRVYIDALVTEADDIANIFSFARAYFMVDWPVPSCLVRFLRSILPGKSTADLYTAIGFHKQGKAEFYRDFLEHLANSSDRLVEAPGTPGMVMLVFTLPSYPYVFKVIRDRFAPPKNTTAAEVVEKYRTIKRHDRVGRMADTWEFSHAAFPRARFAPALLALLEREIPSRLSIEEDSLVIDHLFIERRLKPLNLHLQEAPPERVSALLADYGAAVAEISASGIFPGDLLLKNFGVTRSGRVIFYDYDEIQPIGECRFRAIPEPQTPEQEMAAEPWYSVGPNDVFPEEFRQFLLRSPQQRRQLATACPALFDPAHWQRIQAACAAGEIPDVRPYRAQPAFADPADSG